MHRYLSFALYSHCAAAAVLSAPTAAITAPAFLHRRAATTVGYYSTGSSDGTVQWGTVTIEREGGMVATSGSQFVVCQSNPCLFGSCSAGTFIIGSTTTACGAASSLTCSSNLLYQDVFDTAPLTNFFCDSATETGFVMYKVTPTGTVPSPASVRSTSSASSSNAESSSSAAAASSSTAVSSTSPVPNPLATGDTPPESTKAKKSTPIGAIVGGVVGGIAVIGALIVAAIFLIRRSRTTPPAQPNYTMPPPQETKPYAGMAVAPPPEKVPGVATYPYAVEVGGAPAPPLSPVPQYTPNNGAINELPAQRM